MAPLVNTPSSRAEGRVLTRGVSRHGSPPASTRVPACLASGAPHEDHVMRIASRREGKPICAEGDDGRAFWADDDLDSRVLCVLLVFRQLNALLSCSPELVRFSASATFSSPSLFAIAAQNCGRRAQARSTRPCHPQTRPQARTRLPSTLQSHRSLALKPIIELLVAGGARHRRCPSAWC